jgi:hypothetical protein
MLGSVNIMKFSREAVFIMSSYTLLFFGVQYLQVILQEKTLIKHRSARSMYLKSATLTNRFITGLKLSLLISHTNITSRWRCSMSGVQFIRTNVWVRSTTASHGYWRQLGRLSLMNVGLVFTRASGSSPTFSTNTTQFQLNDNWFPKEPTTENLCIYMLHVTQNVPHYSGIMDHSLSHIFIDIHYYSSTY